MPMSPSPSAGLLAPWLLHAKLQGGRPAIYEAGRELTHASLLLHVDALAQALAHWGVQSRDRVGVHIGRSTDSVMLLLALLRLGAAYVPMTGHQPAAAAVAHLARSDVRRVVCGTEMGPRYAAAGLQWQTPDVLHRLAAPVLGSASVHPFEDPSAIAYVIQTSGTGGRSKSVAVTRGNLAAHVRAVSNAYGLDESDRVLHACSLGFDVSLEEVLPTLCCGGCVVIGPDPLAAPLSELDVLVGTAAITVLNLPTPLWGAWLDQQSPAAPGPSLRLVVIGSDTCPAGRIRDWQALGWRHVRCLNAYGLTETTITNAAWPLPGADDPPWQGVVPIGWPLAGSRLYVLDEDGAPVPPGECGELYVAGPQVALGYLGATEDSAARFLADAGSQRAGAAMYRTGDLASVTADGAFVVAGRLDRQFKLRGFRVEPGEVERVLEQQAGVQAAAVVPLRLGETHQLVAYLQVTAAFSAPRGEFLGCDAPGGILAVASGTARQVADYMLPTLYMVLDRLPLTANGKVAHARLPVPATAADAVQRADAACDPRQACVEACFGFRPDFALGFYAAGGDSLLALRIVAALRDAGFALALSALLGAPRLRDALAAAEPIAVATDEGAPRAARAFITGLQLELSELAALRSQASLWSDIDFLCDATPMQRTMLTLSLRHPRSGNCIEQVEGRVHLDDPDRFHQAWQAVAVRHEALRSHFRYRHTGAPILVCRKQATLDWQLLDWRGLSPDEQRARAAAWLVRDRAEGFPAASQTPSRWRLAQVGENEYHFFWTYHHALLDGWSDVLLLEEAFAIERFGVNPVVAKTGAPGSYRDFVAWRRIQDEAGTRDFWRQALAHLDRRVPWRISADHASTPTRWQRLALAVPAVTSEALQAMAKRLGVALSQAYTAAFGLGLCSVRGCARAVFGQFVWVRPTDLHELARTAGMFINIVPTWVDRGDATDSGLAALHARHLAREPHTWLDAEEISGCAPGGAGSVLYDAAMVYENYPVAEGSPAMTLRNHAQCTLPVTLYVWPGTPFRLELVHDASRVTPVDAARLLDATAQMLTQLAGPALAANVDPTGLATRVSPPTSTA